MPIYEFRCLECNDLFEILLMNDDDKAEMRCPKCKGENFERVLSSAAFNMDASSAKGQTYTGPQTHTCSSGSCTTYDIPGHTRD